MKVRYREQALTDLEQIFNYIGERNPDGARNVIMQFMRRSPALRDKRLSARRISDPAVRVKIVGRYHYKSSIVSARMR